MQEESLFGLIEKAPAIKRNGYAAPPGAGKKGETCKTCKHKYKYEKFFKCNLMKGSWTHGYATDILLKAPACKYWEETNIKE